MRPLLPPYYSFPPVPSSHKKKDRLSQLPLPPSPPILHSCATSLFRLAPFLSPSPGMLTNKSIPTSEPNTDMHRTAVPAPDPAGLPAHLLRRLPQGVVPLPGGPRGVGPGPAAAALGARLHVPELPRGRARHQARRPRLQPARHVPGPQPGPRQVRGGPPRHGRPLLTRRARPPPRPQARGPHRGGAPRGRGGAPRHRRGEGPQPERGDREGSRCRRCICICICFCFCFCFCCRGEESREREKEQGGEPHEGVRGGG
ncbi:uncharacterized protein P884DRAFT_11598 [Thermothelomyces heterothallicus CBS 202.75]|uniref:uncharacterized protein n=1 Tax=Thermothelomyces heterothallicus CBS 202.75 TaxID=1149848 RepID=UPI0037421346